MLQASELGLGGTLGDIDTLNEVHFAKSISRMKKGLLQGSPLYYLGFKPQSCRLNLLRFASQLARKVVLLRRLFKSSSAYGSSVN